MFQNLWAGIKHSVAMILISLQVRPQEDVEAEVESHTPEHVQAVHAEAPGLQQVFGETRDEYVRDAFSPTQEDGNAFSPEALAHEGVLVHRNDPCPSRQRAEIQAVPRQTGLIAPKRFSGCLPRAGSLKSQKQPEKP